MKNMEYSKLSAISYLKKVLTISALVAFCSLFHFNFFVEGFIITISVIVLPLLLYFNSVVNSFVTCFAVSIVSPTFRLLTLIAGGLTFQKAFQIIWPEVFFYMVYGIVFYWLYTRSNRQIHQFIITVFASDLISNIVEMSLRLGRLIIPFDIFRGLAVVALVRTVVIIILFYVFIKLRQLMIAEENKKNYDNLLLITSNFWSEIYFMQKNTAYIEELMAKAFNLYKYAEAHASDATIVNKSLDLAKEVHEVKKDYLRVIKGLEAITEEKLYQLSLSIDEIVRIIVENSRKTLASANIAIEVVTDIRSQAKVYYHFYMTSVLQNIMSNAIEAIGDNAAGKIEVTAYETANELHINIADNGCGIKKRDIPYIYNPGYSSKYSEQSGDIKRGLGLNVVKNLVEDEFGGQIAVSSETGRGTCFTLTFPLNRLKGK